VVEMDMILMHWGPTMAARGSSSDDLEFKGYNLVLQLLCSDQAQRRLRMIIVVLLEQ